jgi:hypothetical protein
MTTHDENCQTRTYGPHEVFVIEEDAELGRERGRRGPAAERGGPQKTNHRPISIASQPGWRWPPAQPLLITVRSQITIRTL